MAAHFEKKGDEKVEVAKFAFLMFHGPAGARARRPPGPSGPIGAAAPGGTGPPPTAGPVQSRSLTQAMYFNGSDPLDALEGLPVGVGSLPSAALGRPRRMSRARAILAAIGAVVFIGFMMTVQELVFGDGGLGGSAVSGGGGVGGSKGGGAGEGGMIAAHRAAATAAGGFRAPLTLRMSYGEEEDPLGVWVLAQSALAHLTGSSSQGGLVPVAGLPRFPRLFARDALVSVLLMESVEAPVDVLRTLGQLQGTGSDPATGMEPGKVCERVSVGGRMEPW